MMILNNGYDFNSITRKKILKATNEALNNYHYRTLFKSEDEIVKHGKYEKSELRFILDSILEVETARKYILDELYDKMPLSLKEILNLFEFPEENIIRDVIYLVVQGYLEKFIDKSTGNLRYRLIQKKFKPQKNVIDTISIIQENNLCCQCGLCSSICPSDGIKLTNKNIFVDEIVCIRCGLCYYVCPQSFSFKDEINYLKSQKYDLRYTKYLGYYKNIYSARTHIQKIWDYIQDGGIVSTLIYYMLKNKLVDAVITVKHSKNFWKPEIDIVQDFEKIKQVGGTIYTHTPLLSVLNETKNYENIAIIALPCKINALQKGSLFPVRLPLFDNIKYKIGLFCWESLSYNNMFQFIAKNFDVPIYEIIKMNIKKGKFIIDLESGDVLAIPLKEWYKYAYNFCNYCDDFTAEFADISIAGIGSKIGWSTIITRNENGENLFKKVLNANLIECRDLKKGDPNIELIEKVSKRKIERCKSIQSNK